MKKRCCGKRLLGDHSPRSLLDTIIFYDGLFFALRSGKEYRQPKFNPCQIQLVEISYLRYTEDVSKNHPGGLQGRIVSPKTVIHHANRENLDRCFVRLFKLYQSLCPPDAPHHAFYLQPLKKPTSTSWYSNQPLGHSNLANVRLCKQAGIQGYKTNHSLKVTVASHLYQAGVDEQLVMVRGLAITASMAFIATVDPHLSEPQFLNFNNIHY